jgi:hypothetical protein
MRVVVGSGLTRDLKQAEMDRHLRFVSAFIERAEREVEPRTVSMILRAPTSSAAEALMGLSQELARAGVVARIVVAKLEPDEGLRRLFASLSELSPRQPARNLIRWARNPRLLDAHEQATYGTSMCWSGDAMRREADRRNALSLFDDEAPDTARLSQLAFEALWSASVAIADRRLIGPAMPRPSGAYESDQGSMPGLSQLRQAPQGWPLLRH